MSPPRVKVAARAEDCDRRCRRSPAVPKTACRHRRETPSSSRATSRPRSSRAGAAVVPGPSSTPSTARSLAIANLVIVVGTDITLLIRSDLAVGTRISIGEGAGGPARLHMRPRRLPSARRVRLSTSPCRGAVGRGSPRTCRRGNARSASLPLDLGQSEDHLRVVLVRSAHGSHAVDHSRLDLDEAAVTVALHRPPGRPFG